MGKSVRILLVAAIALVVALGGAAYFLRAKLRDSLPLIDGTVRVRGLQSAVTVARDALGIPTIRGISREDVARATGFLHAQDRFFQMDLARRRAAGELAALVGDGALRFDRQMRVHRFRAEARRALALLSPHDRTVLEAYTAGVNRGLAALRTARSSTWCCGRRRNRGGPRTACSWCSRCSSRCRTPTAPYESTLATMHDVLPQPMFESPGASRHGMGLAGGRRTDSRRPPMPAPEVYDLRAQTQRATRESSCSTDREIAANRAESVGVHAGRRRASAVTTGPSRAN